MYIKIWSAAKFVFQLHFTQYAQAITKEFPNGNSETYKDIIYILT